MTEAELVVFLAGHCAPGLLDQLAEQLVGHAVDDLAAGRDTAAASATNIAALVLTAGDSSG